jgi:hypothetical protein
MQRLPQPAQFVEVPSWVSQPACVVQSAKPALQPVAPHVMTPPMPMLHASVELGMSQRTPQPPQSLSVVMERSQPFDTVVSQSRQPASQPVITHAPLSQLDVPCAGVAHVPPHTPQFVREFSSVSQPLSGLPSQSPKPIWQVGLQPLAEQAVVP